LRCHNKILHTGSLKHKSLRLLRSGNRRSKIKVAAGLVWWGLPLELHKATSSPCAHVAFSHFISVMWGDSKLSAVCSYMDTGPTRSELHHRSTLSLHCFPRNPISKCEHTRGQSYEIWIWGHKSITDRVIICLF
jgi:hypothetical protein